MFSCNKPTTCPATGRKTRCARTRGHVGRCDCCGHNTRPAQRRDRAFGNALTNVASGGPVCNTSPWGPRCKAGCRCLEHKGHRGKHICPHCGRRWR
jgi:hypothetical protein